VEQPDRSCQVAVNTDQKFLLASAPNNRSGGDTVACGSRDRPWLLEAPPGQRVNISLLDFSGSSSSTSSVQRARTVETTSSSRCVRQFGFIEDKSANRNVDICSDAAHRQQTLYVSQTNEVAVVLHATQQTTGHFLISVKGSTNLEVYYFSIKHINCCQQKTRISAVAERPRDASCH